MLITLQFYACWFTASGLLQVVGDTTGVDEPAISLAVHNADAILETITVLTHGKLHYGIPIEGFGGKRALGILRKIELCQKRSKFRMQFCLGVLNNVLHVFSLKLASF